MKQCQGRPILTEEPATRIVDRVGIRWKSEAQASPREIPSVFPWLSIVFKRGPFCRDLPDLMLFSRPHANHSASE